MFRAALEVGLAQRAFAFLAAARGEGWIGSPARLAGVLNGAARALDWMGTATGGMVVSVKGLDAAGQQAQRAWHITAGNDHGPEIPCMAAILLARKLALGQGPPAGAYPAMNLLQLAEFAPEFARWGMLTETVEEVPARDTPPL